MSLFRKRKNEVAAAPEILEVKQEIKPKSKKIKVKRPFDWRRTTENILSIILFVIALYLIGAPFVPQAVLWYQDLTDKDKGYVYQTSHPDLKKQFQSSGNDISNEPTDLKPIPQDNRLEIPAIHVDSPITEGQDTSALLHGTWRRPLTSTPDKGGNTVLAGHRFLYGPTNSMSFYNLDKVKVGDPIIIYWKGKEYDYSVTERKIVPPTAVEIENNTNYPEVTIYTCDPLWTATNRLVLIAKPV